MAGCVISRHNPAKCNLSFHCARREGNNLPPDYSPHDLGLPTITVKNTNGPSYSPIGSTASDARSRIDSNYQLFGNVSLTKGRHNFKTGYEWRRAASPEIDPA